MLTRRNFILSSAAFVACGTAAAKGRDLKNPDLKLGVISDVHIRRPEDVKVVQDVFVWYRANRVDGVVVAGDVADYGLTWQMEAFCGAWEEAFPSGKIPATGQKVELVYVTGNHEAEIWKKINRPDLYPDLDELKARVFNLHLEREWPRLFGEPYRPAFVKTIRGCPLFCCNYLDHNGPKATAAVKELYAAHAAEIPADRPFFHVQHCHPTGTCGWGAAKRKDVLTTFLEGYPNLVCLSGDGHEPLDDPKSIWRGGFTSVNTGTLQHVWGPPRPGETQSVKIRNFPQGLLVRVWPDYVHIERRNFRDNARFDPPWGIAVARTDSLSVK